MKKQCDAIIENENYHGVCVENGVIELSTVFLIGNGEQRFWLCDSHARKLVGNLIMEIAKAKGKEREEFHKKLKEMMISEGRE